VLPPLLLDPMKTTLYSVSKIFTERILRIPDYQRGYAWREKQLKDFWSDLAQLEEERNHYTGVLTLEEVPDTTVSTWGDDYWIVRSKGYSPLYVVDGQQRLTTVIILIQAIIEAIPEGQRLNYTSVDEIRKKFIFDSKDEGISRSYIFGYEKDNPSYEYLKTQIFNETSDSSSTSQETIYTHNLSFAKKYFTERLTELSDSEIEAVYRKITQNFLFNIYTISEEVDVFVAFETMNNRGKPLSHLELLKNRLIYLSTRFNAPDYEREKLRTSINEAWKAVYHYLGKNKDKPLDDDTFLRAHFILYFRGNRNRPSAYQRELYLRRSAAGPGYKDYLLEVEFSPKRVRREVEPGVGPLSVQEVYSYVQSLKESVEIWYSLMNPNDSSLPDSEKDWLAKLNRLDFLEIAPLITVFFQKEKNSRTRIRLLRAVERLLFFRSLTRYSFTFDADKSNIVLTLATQLGNGEATADKVIRDVEEITESLSSNSLVMERITADLRSSGFYAWRGIRYFLYEYELSLKARSKAHRDKIDWDSFVRPERGEDIRDYHTVEHIYPQRPKKDCWIEKFVQYSDKERKALRHSLGNLVPLSSPKNSSFSNQCFVDKVGKEESTVGFRYGSYSENEIASHSDWTAKEIIQRGIKLLSFMETRWMLNFGDAEAKLKVLGLETIVRKEGIRIVSD